MSDRYLYLLFWMAGPAILGLVLSHPALLLVAVAALLLRRWLPDPLLWLRYAARIGSLRGQLELNPNNTTAQRALAQLYLAKRRPKSAIPLLQRACAIEPESAELHYLLGQAQLQAGQPEPALAALDEAIRIAPKLQYGDPYLRRGDALVRLGRADDAERAYEQLVSLNISSLEGWYKLAKIRAQRGERAGARLAGTELDQTFRQLPAFLRRKQWSWWLRGRWLRLWT